MFMGALPHQVWIASRKFAAAAHTADEARRHWLSLRAHRLA